MQTNVILLLLSDLLSFSISIIMVITIHEFIKAVMSTMFGDDTPKRNKRLTLNPKSHIEPFGFLVFLIYGVGWGNPVPISTRNYSNKKVNVFIVYFMPILIHFILAHFVGSINVSNEILSNALSTFAACNYSMARFNLIPIIPCAMGYVLPELLNTKAKMTYMRYMETFKVVLAIIIFIGFINYIIYL